MKIAIAGMGYVGLSLSVLLAQHHTVSVYDPEREKVEMLGRRVSPIRDEYIESFLHNKSLDLLATMDEEIAYKDARYVIIAVPTNYDAEQNSFDTSVVESVIAAVLRYAPEAIMVIKSTVPIGYTEAVRKRFETDNILFSPEFLREGRALYDNLHPSRIIMGTDMNNERLMEQARTFAKLLEEGAEKSPIDTLLMGFTEAEAVKLFANTYLAMRISYFNELDTFAETNGLNTEQIVRGVCLDPRIGMYYNNPSFGYGGYCLPKDTKQLLANFEGVPQTMIRAVVASNTTRENFITGQILRRLDQIELTGSRERKTVGIYRLTVKKDADNFRFSAILNVIEGLRESALDLLLYEPFLKEDETVPGCQRIWDLEEFKRRSDLIVANRYEPGLRDVADKLYTRDLFGRD